MLSGSLGNIQCGKRRRELALDIGKRGKGQMRDRILPAMDEQPILREYEVRARR